MVPKKNGKKYILITGGAFSNTGAQAMSIIVINEMMIKYPDYKCVMLVNKENYKNVNKSDYKFEIAEFGIRSNQFFSKVELSPYLHSLFEQAALMIDVSGYAFSSQWGYENSLKYLIKLKLAHQYKIKTYLMPQSFGPLDYEHIWDKIKILLLSKISFRYPEIIYAREKEGYHSIKMLCGNNLKRAHDMVITYKNDIILDNIFTDSSKLNYIKLKTESNVAIIPNIRLVTHGQSSKRELLQIYKNVITKLLQYGKNVYLIAHSIEDKSLCKSLKDEFMTEDKVFFIAEDLNFLEFEALISQFEYIVASRFHSIVHAYKQGVPCFVFGWATKYYELLKLFQQEKYLNDIRATQHITSYEKNLMHINENYRYEKKLISKKLKKITQYDIFDTIKL